MNKLKKIDKLLKILLNNLHYIFLLFIFYKLYNINNGTDFINVIWLCILSVLVGISRIIDELIAINKKINKG